MTTIVVVRRLRVNKTFIILSRIRVRTIIIAGKKEKNKHGFENLRQDPSLDEGNLLKLILKNEGTRV